MIFKRNKNTPNKERQPDVKKNQKVFSYYTASRNQIDYIDRHSAQNASLKERKTRSYKNKLFIGLSLVVIVGLAIYLTILDNQAHLQIIGTKYRTTKNYQEIISKELGANLSNRNKFTLDDKKLSESIQNKLPESLTVTVRSSLLGHQPNVRLETVEPLGILTQNGSKYIISSHGKVLISTDESTVNYANLTTIKNESGVKVSPNMQFLRPSEAAEILLLVKQLNQDKTNYFIVLSSQPHQINLYEAGKGYYVKFLLDNNSILKQYGAMRAVDNKLSKNGQKPSEYMDVRLSDKVFYK